MNITTEAKDDQVLISFNPEIDPELKQYSETSLAKTSESMKYLPLQLWARHKAERNDDYKKHAQYENDHALAIAETKRVVEGMKDDRSDDKSFTLFYHSLPAYVCAVLIRDHLEELDAEDREFCKNILIEHASMPLKESYRYQAGDGAEVAISALPSLLSVFPEDASGIKKILLFTLFDSYPVGVSQRMSDHPTGAILNTLWKESFADANSIFLGFLMLKPALDELRESTRREGHKRGVYDFSNHDVLKAFAKTHEAEISKIVSNKYSYSDIPNIDQIDLDTLLTAFRLLPIDTADETHEQFLHQIFPIFSKKLFVDGRKRDREDDFDYSDRQRFLEKLSYVVLSSKVEDIEAYLKPFLNDFKDSENAAQLFSEFVTAEDRLAHYEQFWTVWELFYPKVVALAKGNASRFYSGQIIHNYLLAWSFWRKEAREWHSLKDREKSFFKRVSEDMGGNPATLYSLAKVLNDIGSGFKDDGIHWLSDMLDRNPDLSTGELEVNTVYYLEMFIRSHVIRNRNTIKKTLQLKNRVLTILDYLLSKGSETAYLLREDIL
jgi:hypothetical protein